MIGADSDAAVGTKQVCIVFTVDAQDADAAAGVKRYLNYIYPLVTLTPLYGQHQEATGMDWPWRGTPTRDARSHGLPRVRWWFARAGASHAARLRARGCPSAGRRWLR